jgi:uncharacterized damage-inducible protein DinB
MTITTRRLLCALTIGAAALLPTLAFADDPVPAGAPTGIRKDMINSMGDAGDKLVELASATPEKKFTWRPNKETRSVSEVYMHVVMANYMLPGFVGVKAPMAIDMKTFEKSTTNKDQIVKMLKDSFVFAKSAINQQSDDHLNDSVDMFGNPSTKLGALMILVNHSHEHLGQSIAYARVNGLTPPWTARQEAAAKQKKEAGK